MKIQMKKYSDRNKTYAFSISDFIKNAKYTDIYGRK